MLPFKKRALGQRGKTSLAQKWLDDWHRSPADALTELRQAIGSSGGGINM